MLRRLFGGSRAQDNSRELLAQAYDSFKAGAYDDAERLCAACLDAAADFVEAHHLHALIALARGELEPAFTRLKLAAGLDDSGSPFHGALGSALQYFEAHEAAAHHLARALDLARREDPARAELMLCLSDSLIARKEFQQAERVLRELLSAIPEHPEALSRLASVRFYESDAREARSLMDRYLAARPEAGLRLRRALMMPVILESNEEIDALRSRLERDLDELGEARLAPIRDPVSEVALTAFYVAYHGRRNRDLLRKFGRVCRALYPARAEAPKRSPAGRRRLRIGFVSTFFFTHSVGRTTLGLIKDLPRSDFEVHVFAVAPHEDEMAREIRLAAERYAALPRNLEQVRAAIEAAELDILLFADIGMEPLTTFLSLWRLAPLQLNTWGHSVTSGIDTVDYYVSGESVEAAGAQELYSEKLMRLPGYFMPRYHRPPALPRKSREELGLPADRHLYFSPQSLFKLHPDFDAALHGILARDPRAEIVLSDSRASWKELLRGRLARRLGKNADRVRFMPSVPQREFQQYLAAADVIIDPFHFGGCNTSCEALGLGIPIVTLPAFQLPGRFTLGLYRELGLDACIAGSESEFVELAVRVGTEPDLRRSICAQIAERSERLFERPDTGRALGEALLRIARR